ncbi:hypothetical protein NQZ68_026128 [Dissostichus eleginoides]|nr:hypothetical protein NQZ68_026128 [Dissostichus eleginoides]
MSVLWDAASDTPPGETPSGGQEYSPCTTLRSYGVPPQNPNPEMKKTFASPPPDLKANEHSHSELLPGRLVGLRWSFQGMTALATAVSDALTLFNHANLQPGSINTVAPQSQIQQPCGSRSDATRHTTLPPPLLNDNKTRLARALSDDVINCNFW